MSIDAICVCVWVAVWVVLCVVVPRFLIVYPPFGSKMEKLGEMLTLVMVLMIWPAWIAVAALCLCLLIALSPMLAIAWISSNFKR